MSVEIKLNFYVHYPEMYEYESVLSLNTNTGIYNNQRYTY